MGQVETTKFLGSAHLEKPSLVQALPMKNLLPQYVIAEFVSSNHIAAFHRYLLIIFINI